MDTMAGNLRVILVGGGGEWGRGGGGVGGGGGRWKEVEGDGEYGTVQYTK